MSDTVIIHLRTLYAESEAARAFFDLLVQRKNDGRCTVVDRILSQFPAHGRPVSRRDLIQVMQRMEELGVGRCIVGRRSQPSRFEWSSSMTGVARAATGAASSDDLGMAPRPASPAEEEPVDDDEDVLLHRLHLRPDFCLSIELPVDLTQQEAERLAAFIRTLPINTSTPE